MKTRTVIAATPKGARVFLEGITAQLGVLPPTYDVDYTADAITVRFHALGRRRVVSSKGGVIDLQSKQVTTWARGATEAAVDWPAGYGIITITRAA